MSALYGTPSQHLGGLVALARVSYKEVEQGLGLDLSMPFAVMTCLVGN